MTQIKHFYVHNAQGRILRSGYCVAEDFALQALGEGEILVEGQADPIEHIVVDGQLVNRPPSPSPHHQWDFDNLQWTIDIAQVMNAVRAARNLKLRASDWVELPDNLARMPEQELAAWRAYRQALRDITNDLDINNIVWPVAPNADTQPQPQLFNLPTYST